MGSLLSEYHDILQEKLEGRSGEFLYRGQENAGWQLRSGAVRRIFPKKDRVELQKLVTKHRKDFDFYREFLRYHEEELLKPAKLRGWHREIGGRELSDLELLAKLQHHGAATCLLDFTTRFDIALWFACRKARGRDKDGNVFIVDIGSVTRLREIEPQDLKKDIGEFLNFEMDEAERKNPLGRPLLAAKKSKFSYWHPEVLMGRMLSQESRFLFGPRDIPDNEGEGLLFAKKEYLFSINVKQEHKRQLLEDMKRHCGLSQESIFSDIHGFADTNHYQVLFRRKDYLQEGEKKLRGGDIEGAIEDINIVLESDQQNPVAWLHLGSVNFLLGVEKQEQDLKQRQASRLGYPWLPTNEYHEKSVEFFSKAIELDANYADAYSLRAGAYVALGKFDEALSDFETLRDLYKKQRDEEGTKFVNSQLNKLKFLRGFRRSVKIKNELSDS